ncbi:MAG TPA: response regulator [Ignavibacteriaceae bacterium]|nr:response regulator [Ignavibacteriaceae bacterium]
MKRNPARKKILIAEDEIIIALDIQKILINNNYKICSIVFSGEEAIRKAVEEKPSLILMDIMLQGSINGIQAAEAISQKQNIPIIFLTGVDGNETLAKVQITERFRYISKPYDEEILRSVIEDTLHKNQNGSPPNLEPRIFGSLKFFKN